MLACFRKCPVATVTTGQIGYKYSYWTELVQVNHEGKEIDFMALGPGKVKSHLQNPLPLGVESPRRGESAYRQSFEGMKLVAWQAAVAGGQERGLR